MADPCVHLVWEEVGIAPDEGYDRFAEEAVRAIGRRRPVVSHRTRRSRHALLQPAARLLRAVAIGLRIRARGGPVLLVYSMRNPVTVPGVVRAAIIRILARGPLLLVVLVPNRASAAAMWVLRRLRPDALLLSSEADRTAARRAGLEAGRVWSGVDVERFRPALPGEKRALRRRWGLPESGRVLLHVGHLRHSRALDLLLPLAAAPATTLLVLASDRRTRESEAIRAELTAAGAVVLEGYQPRVEELYRLADCYVFPGAKDGAVSLPLSVLEALASGVPVVAAPYEALVDHLPVLAGVTILEDPSRIGPAVDAAIAAGLHPDLPRALTWDGVAELIGAQVDRIAAAARPGGAGGGWAWTVLAVRRQLRNRRVRVAARIGLRPEPPARPVEPLAVDVRAAPGAPARPRGAACARLLLLGLPPNSALGRCAELLGIEVSAGDDAVVQLPRAITERWPLVAAAPRALAALEGAAPLLARHLAGGGTLLVEGLDETTDDDLIAASRRLGFPLPRPVTARDIDALALVEEGCDLFGELAVARLPATGRQASLAPTSGWLMLAAVESHGQARPAMLELRSRSGGRVLATALGGRLESTVSEAMTPAGAAMLVPRVLLLRSLYGAAAWHPPAVIANYTIDDPALVERRFGLPYSRFIPRLREIGVHVTVATIPTELFAADPRVVSLLARHPRHLSACYHGCNHDGYEFTLGRSGELDDGTRARQAAALRRAARLGDQFHRRHGLALDRVMVFPFGVCAAGLLPELDRLGFVASSNYVDRLPLGHPVPAEPDLGARPADLAWHGFPLLWRRTVEHRGWAADLLLGRPLLCFGHSNLFREDPELLERTASEVARATGGRARWASLEQVARHAYLQRQRGADWEVLMTSNEICLHNPGPGTRRYHVCRPHLPEGRGLESGAGGDGACLEVAEGATARVWVTRAQPSSLPAPSGQCLLSELTETCPVPR